MRGLDTLRVFVEDLGSIETEMGLTENGLRTKVELELRKARIPISEDASTSVYVNIGAVKVGSVGYSYAITLHIRDAVLRWADLDAATLLGERRGSVPDSIATLSVASWYARLAGKSGVATLWWSGKMGYTGRSTATSPSQVVTAAVTELLEEMMNEYLASNPHP